LISSFPFNCTNGNLVLVKTCNYTIQTEQVDNSSNSENNSFISSDEEISQVGGIENQEEIVTYSSAEDYIKLSFMERFFCKFLNFFRKDKAC
jgi:hypothetical protein